MDKNSLKQVVIAQSKEERIPGELVIREAYRAVEPFLETPQVIILSGVRRSGKSTWMEVIRRRAAESDYYLNFDDERLATFQLEDCQSLVEVFIELYGIQKTFYFDEIQNLVGWERFVRRLHNEGKKIFVTGSNAELLSREFGTRLTGRNIPLYLFPYSFYEYIQRQNENLLNEKHFGSTEVALIKKYFSEFKVLGGFPEYILHQQKEYLRMLYENIIYKDVIVRNKILHADTIKKLVYYLASNNTKEFSYSALQKLLNITSSNLVSEYCHYLENSFLCFALKRYSFSVRKQIQSSKKMYFIDPALAECVGFRFSEDRGRMLENIVYLQLKRNNQYKDIYYHKEKKECDFVLCEALRVVEAIQVCADLQDPKTKDREIKGLLDAMRTYNLERGLLITEEESGDETITEDGKEYYIKIVPAWGWLLRKSG